MLIQIFNQISMLLQSFYKAVRGFLLESELETEQSLRGHSDEEITLAEHHWNCQFPEAYGLFLKYFGKSTKCFDDQNWGIDVLPFAKELSQEVAKHNKLNLDDWFPFTERQWYSFCSYRIGPVKSENPEVMLIVEGDEGAEVYSYPSFTNWLMAKLENHIHLLVSLERPKASKQLELFEKVKLTL